MPPYASFSLKDLHPINGPIPRGHVFVLMKSYFDGGNQADSTQYDVVTLACLMGTPGQWKRLEADWNIVLKKHKAPWLHTTDAVTFHKPYLKEDGWDEIKRDAFVSDCVTVAAAHIAVPNIKEGLFPFTGTVVLDDFKRAREANPEVPKDATEILATQALNTCFQLGDSRGAHFYDLFFDQNEPYRGHVSDRQRNPKAFKQVPLMERVTLKAEANMRQVPALQVTDLFAWCVSHKNKTPRHNWQERLLELTRVDEWLEYGDLIKPIPGVAALVENWKLPRRRPTR